MGEPEKTIEDRVRDRAYSLWEKDGRPDGGSDEYWQQTRSEVEAEDAEPGNKSPVKRERFEKTLAALEAGRIHRQSEASPDIEAFEHFILTIRRNS